MRKQQRRVRKPTDKKSPRHICHYCRIKRYEDRMTLVFSHPVLTGKKPIWACSYYGYMEGKCVSETIKSLTMYQETGLLQIIPIPQQTVSNEKKGKK